MPVVVTHTNSGVWPLSAGAIGQNKLKPLWNKYKKSDIAVGIEDEQTKNLLKFT